MNYENKTYEELLREEERLNERYTEISKDEFYKYVKEMSDIFLKFNT